MQKLTIKEVAKLAGVSPSAVSFALNGKPGVSEETRKNIIEIVDRLQYTPNPNSRRLLSKTTNNIAVLFKSNASPLDHVFYSELNRTILNECEHKGYNLIFASIRMNGDRVVLPQVVRTYDVDGIIIYGDMEAAILSEIKNHDIPFVLVDCHEVTPGVACVYADYSAAAFTAVKHLIDSGHRNIAYFGGGTSPGFGAQTFAGFRKVFEHHRIVMPLQWIQSEADEFDEGSHFLCLERIFSARPYPTAVFCTADIYAISAIRFLKGRGLRVPEDVSIVSIDDIVLARYVEPMLTTVRIDKVAMGKAALALLLQCIGKQPTENIVTGPSSLVRRDSVKVLRG